VVVAARPGKAKDKAKVEGGVLIAQRWIVARLRHRTFFEHAELGEAVAQLLEELNARPMQKLGVSRRELWERLDRPALLPLPTTRYEQAQWKTCRVNTTTTSTSVTTSTASPTSSATSRARRAPPPERSRSSTRVGAGRERRV
jgi:hypothetical protein